MVKVVFILTQHILLALSPHILLYHSKMIIQNEEAKNKKLKERENVDRTMTTTISVIPKLIELISDSLSQVGFSNTSTLSSLDPFQITN